MALTATVYSIDVQLNDVDRGVYDALTFKAAQHPSESNEYFVARILAYCLEYAEGISFGKGLAEPDEPAITIRVEGIDRKPRSSGVTRKKFIALPANCVPSSPPPCSSLSAYWSAPQDGSRSCSMPWRP